MKLSDVLKESQDLNNRVQRHRKKIEAITIDLGNIEGSSVSVDGIDTKDYPDFTDAYIDYAEWKDGTPLTDDELDALNDQHSDYVYSKVEEHLY